MLVVLGADHAGFELKEKLKAFLKRSKVEFEDVGAKALNPKDDYVDFAFKAAEKVASNKIPGDARGILLCGSGIGMAVAANKVKGISAVVANSEKETELSRLKNNSNVLCLAAREISFAKAKKIVSKWLKTEFTNEARHVRRLEKIKRFEEMKWKN